MGVYFVSFCRSQAYMKKELYGAALEDAANAITMDEGYVKVSIFLFCFIVGLGIFPPSFCVYGIGKI